MSMIHRYRKGGWLGLSGVFLWASLVLAQPPAATITAFTKDVFVSFQGNTPVPAIIGTLIRQGDSIRTYSEADAQLHLPDGSKLHLKENTNFRAIMMDKEPLATSRFELLWGRVRAVLSPLYQQPDSSFTLRTPNARVNVMSSELDAEVVYDPATKTTIVLAHEFDADVRNIVTGVSLHLPQGHSAIIDKENIQEIAEILDLSQTPTVQQEPATLTSLEGEVFVSFQGAESTSAIKGIILRAGDEVYTDVNARAVLEFSDGTTLGLGEDTNIEIFKLAKDAQGGWISRLKLFRGSLRAVPGEGFRTAASSFIVQTSNVRMAVKPAEQMDAEILYDPNTSVTTLISHKSDLVITHLLTAVSVTIPEKQSGIIYNHVIQQIGRDIRPVEDETPSQQEEGTPKTNPQK